MRGLPSASFYYNYIKVLRLIYKLMSNNSLISSEEGLGALVEITFPLVSKSINLGMLKIA